MTAPAQIGERRSYDGALCTVRYVGEVAGTTGSWLGVEWDDPSRGKHGGQHKGVRYFSCISKSPTAASFVRPTRSPDAPQSFLSALNLKYAGDPEHDKKNPPRQIKFSGKIAEEVGFEKIRLQQARLDELQFVILDGAQLAVATEDGEEGEGLSIGRVCPKVLELDLSRNLFEGFGPVVRICSELRLLRSLRVNGNRFKNVLNDEVLASAGDAFAGVKELALEDTLLSWEEICHIASKFPSLTTLHAGSNQLETLMPIPADAPFTATLTSLHLEFNDFTSVSDLVSLASISTLRNLLLKGNRVVTINATPSAGPLVFGDSLHYVDLSYNSIATWSFVDTLPATFPALTSLRLTHNPLYANPDLDEFTPAITTTTTTEETSEAQDETGSFPRTQRIVSASNTTTTAKKSEEAYMLTLARLPSLRVLNFSTVTAADRADAEMFYLSRIARQLAAVPADPAAEADVLRQHRRWGELCEMYGEPVVVRKSGEVDAGFLEARLIRAEFTYDSSDDESGEGGKKKKQEEEKKTVVIQVPMSFDIYAVKGIVGRAFGLKPLGLRLVWETGEWDPVGGFDEGDGESEEEEEEEAPVAEVSNGGTGSAGRKTGRWVKREAELRDGPRQFGYCVDGLEAKIRVERR
ncbi:hypothetical protein B0J18DRAFT_415348 [Chaetomium sp. MPI-SDFR-AT-0129]|nr:hypothetical protein B0J18DRAFT_415348 [Chaetomium sp. MPI-SDFR-AT-0129]